ncbi:hypothetical protein PFISCL1PPCAC_15880, partial [Pristionchus fissidentatus]
DKREIDRKLIEKFLECVDFCSLDLRFFDVNQQSIFDLAVSSGRPIDCFHSFDASINAEMVADLPRVGELIVQQKEGFSDTHVVAIAEQDHCRIELSANLSDRNTIIRLIEIVQASEYMTELTIHVAFSYLNDFLSSLNLREEGNKLMDTRENTTVILKEDDNKIGRYFLNFGEWCMQVEWSSYNTRSVIIYDGQLPEDCKPSHAVTLPIV